MRLEGFYNRKIVKQLGVDEGTIRKRLSQNPRQQIIRILLGVRYKYNNKDCPLETNN